jgi:Flp pilus assembly protein protease CpaA
MYSSLLLLHAVLALAVLILIPTTIISSFTGSKLSGKLGLFAMIGTHIQLLVGLYLYLAGSMGYKLFQVEGVMKEAHLRFYAVEHITTMILAIILATLARRKWKKEFSSSSVHTKSGVLWIVTLVLIASRIPWERWPFIW